MALSCYASRVRRARIVFVAGVTALAGVTMSLASPRLASADAGRTSSLSWLRMPGTDSCIATQALARSIEERLGRHVFVSAAAADVSVEGRIEKRAEGGWHSVITVRDGKGALLGTRELDRPDASCEAMNEPLALVIAVMIDPEAKLSAAPAPLPSPLRPSGTQATDAQTTGAPPRVGAVAPGPAPMSAPADAASAAPPPRAREPWRFEGHATGTINVGLAPSLAPGASIAGILSPPGIPLGFRGYASLFLPTTAEQDGARASFDLVYVGGAVCPTLRRPAVVAMLCFGGQLGILRSHPDSPSRGIDDKTTGLWNAVSEARLTVPIVAPIALTAGISGILPILRPTYEYTPSRQAGGSGGSAGARENLHKVAAFGFAADLGVSFFFP